ncbi:pre-peptidase C-terminal domain-containing protein [Kribbella deserti]|uniref:Pre-peptidase C-terminal domain-containing protein n=1 Tax=Kribbella deserti TaxID=1926257 RepID=A0ABV6QLB4_9ACTN
MRSTTFRRTGALVTAGAVAFAALAVNAGAAPAPIDRVLDQPTQGRAALGQIELDDVAQRNRLPEAQLLKTLASDKTAWLDTDGRLFFREPTAPAATRSELSPRWAKKAVAAAEGPAFELHSKPGANRVIYLDFDGHTITGTAWNTDGKPATVNVTPYDTDGNPAVFGTAEQDVVRDVWTRVAEDYAPFDVDVTTQAPPQAAIDRTDANDQQFGTRVLIDPDTWYESGCGCGGVAYIGVYDTPGNHDYYQPALVFTRGVGTGAKNLAEAASHEAGHNIGLGHDGTASQGYYEGHGAWAPIMGVGYYRGISQWSKGEYSGASNPEDDFAVAGSHGLPLRADDHGNGTSTATVLTIGTPIAGVSATADDVDVFRVEIGAAGNYTANATAAAIGGNLDIKLDLLNSAGTVVGTNNPAAGQTDAGTPTGLNAAITQNLQPGTYYLRVAGTGYGDPLSTGYTTYGSRGGFTLTVSKA